MIITKRKEKIIQNLKANTNLNVNFGFYLHFRYHYARKVV